MVLVDDQYLGANDTTISTVLRLVGTDGDANDANNLEIETTQYVTPKANLAITVADTVDPVLLGEGFDSLVRPSNFDPDSTTNMNIAFSLSNDGSVRCQSIFVPPGFQYSLIAVGGALILLGSTANLANGSSVQFLITVDRNPQAIDAQTEAVVQATVTSSSIADSVLANDQATESTRGIPMLVFEEGCELRCGHGGDCFAVRGGDRTVAIRSLSCAIDCRPIWRIGQVARRSGRVGFG